jgi:hypothetical protein
MYFLFNITLCWLKSRCQVATLRSQAVSIGSRHIPFERLIDFAEGRLSPDEQAQSRAHVSACHRCAAEVAWLECVIELMRTNDIEEPPPRVATHIMHSFRSRSAPELSPLRQRIMAALRFDSAQLPLPVGMRSGPIAERQLVFSAEGINDDHVLLGVGQVELLVIPRRSGRPR